MVKHRKPLSAAQKAKYSAKSKKKRENCKESIFFNAKTGRPKQFLKMGGGSSYRLHVPGYTFSGKLRKQKAPTQAQLNHRRNFGAAQKEKKKQRLAAGIPTKAELRKMKGGKPFPSLPKAPSYSVQPYRDNKGRVVLPDEMYNRLQAEQAAPVYSFL